MVMAADLAAEPLVEVVLAALEQPAKVLQVEIPPQIQVVLRVVVVQAALAEITVAGPMAQLAAPDYHRQLLVRQLLEPVAAAEALTHQVPAALVG